MRIIRDWLERRLSADHAKLVATCKVKADAMLERMEAAQALRRDPGTAYHIVMMNAFVNRLGQLEIKLNLSGKLDPYETNYLNEQLRRLNQMQVVTGKGQNQGGPKEY